ncbi:MAG: PilZ domain-containing protein [Candidatus Gastranaerophilales bacterium]|nr:PilZ domain-containing protein [Candidatus Gastranaerophilales bacterium]
MKKTVSENQKFIILSPKVTNATKCRVTQLFDDESFQVELMSKERYSDGDKVDLFSVAGSGIVYISADIKSVDKKTLVINKPEKTTVIQRREYTRVEIHKNILINHDNKNIRAEIIDISAGGMRLLADKEMFSGTDYQVDVSLETRVNFSCKFSPVRIIYDENIKKYNVSGKFKLIKNIDRVALEQFCMKKQSEKTNE